MLLPWGNSALELASRAPGILRRVRRFPTFRRLPDWRINRQVRVRQGRLPWRSYCGGRMRRQPRKTNGMGILWYRRGGLQRRADFIADSRAIARIIALTVCLLYLRQAHAQTPVGLTANVASTTARVLQVGTYQMFAIPRLPGMGDPCVGVPANSGCPRQ
jgi:hypothetical protein